jgi:small-conductance mechanosensitive channel
MEQFQEGLGEAWSNVASFLPVLLGALLILVIGYFVAKALEKAVDKILERVGFDRWVERGGIKRALESSEYDASSLLGRLIFYVVMLFVLQLAFGVFGPNPISELITGIIGYLPRIFVAVIIVVIGAAMANAVRDMIQNTFGGLEYGRMLGLAASWVILAIAGFAALDQLQIAPNIVNGLFYALLAIVVGSSVIAFGGGGIPVARGYVERWSQRAERESQRMRRQAEQQDGGDTRRRSGTSPEAGAGSRRVQDIDLRDDQTRQLPPDDAGGGAGEDGPQR